MSLPISSRDAPAQPRLHHVACLGAKGLHQMAYWEWGEPSNPRVVVCVHGLSRQGRDFDTLAQDLSPHFRVVCPDVVGRGRSDWLGDPAGYAIPNYVSDMVTLIARLDAQQLDWVGTSMGGLIGLGVASLPWAAGPAGRAEARMSGPPGVAGDAAAARPSLLRRLVLNDVGPTLEVPALQRIGGYLGLPARWGSVEEAADALWQISQGFGPHTREQWLALTGPQLRAHPQGGFVSHYDPAIAVPFRALTPELAAAGEAALWHAWESLQVPTLLLRGAQSDLLSAQTAQRMCRSGPRARLHEFPGVGHAPTLVQADQRAVVRDFLLS